ncbi:MAG: sulfite exporter TauE/SafE family protein [Acidobacteria bacterium]|nr:sulfite exporter TauE/SafE family protein [Acidobacteriota bacterium]
MFVLFTFLAGVGAGSVGALLGLGGGIFLVPILNIGVGLPIGQATAISLITVISTSNFVSLTSAGRKFANVRLALVLQVFSVAGAIAGTFLLDYLSPGGQERVFGATAALVAMVMVSRLNHRNVLHGVVEDLGTLGGRVEDPETGTEVAYRLRRLPLAVGVAGGAGVISTLAGVGGGVLIVPALNSWCGVPMRVAAATSAAIIGVTAFPGVLDSYARGNLTAPMLAAGAVLGAMVGSRLGFWVGAKVKVRSLKIFMALVLAVVASRYLFFK